MVKGRHVFVSSLLMFIQHFRSINGYLWIIGSRINVDSTVKNKPYERLENPQTGMVSVDLSMESMRASFLNSKRGLTVPHQHIWQ